MNILDLFRTRRVPNRDVWPSEYYHRGQIAIARDYAMVIHPQTGEVLRLTRDNPPHPVPEYKGAIQIAAGFAGNMALFPDGHILTCGRAHEFECWRSIEALREVRDVISCEGHTAGIHKDGRLFCLDEPGGWEGVPNLERVVDSLRHEDIRQLAMGFSNVMALTQSGQVMYYADDGFSDNNFYDRISDAIEIDAYSHYYGDNYAMALLSDGRVVTDSFKGTEFWRYITHVSVGADIAIGLKRDGSIEMIDTRGTRLEVKSWKNLVAIECKFFGVVGFTADGDVRYFFA